MQATPVSDPVGTATAAVAAHVAAADPHTQYLTAAEGVAAFDAIGAAAAAQAASQPVDSDLTAIAALTTTAYGRAFLALADAAAARTAAGLGTISMQDANNVTITGGSVTGITDLTPADGGTGASNTATSGTFLRGNGTNFVTSTLTLPNTLTANQLLHATGTDIVGGNAGLTFDGNMVTLGTSAALLPKLKILSSGAPTNPSQISFFASGVAEFVVFQNGSDLGFAKNPAGYTAAQLVTASTLLLTANGVLCQPIANNFKVLQARGKAGQTANLQQWEDNSGNAYSLVDATGKFRIGGTAAPTALMDLAAGTTVIAPQKFTSGPLLTAAAAGAVEFLTDKFYGTITTGAARKEYTLNDAALTSGRIPQTTTDGRLTDSSGLTVASDVITAAAYKAASVTFATLPSAASGSGNQYRVSDIGPSGYGSIWASNGTRWAPLHGRATLAQLGAAQTGIANTETIVLQALIPAGAWQVNDTLRLALALGKSGTTDGLVLTIRVGTAGTTGDTAVMTLTAIAAASRSAGQFQEIKLISATTAQRMGSVSASGAYAAPTATATPAAVTISSAASNALYVSVSIESNGATNTVEIYGGSIELLTP